MGDPPELLSRWCIAHLNHFDGVVMFCLLVQAEEELERAQKVFDDINVDLQEELPSLWNR